MAGVDLLAPEDVAENGVRVSKSVISSVVLHGFAKDFKGFHSSLGSKSVIRVPG